MYVPKLILKLPAPVLPRMAWFPGTFSSISVASMWAIFVRTPDTQPQTLQVVHGWSSQARVDWDSQPLALDTTTHSPGNLTIVPLGSH